MTTRYSALTVILDRDIREDDAEPLMAAIRMLKGVIRVEGYVADLDERIAECRIKSELRQQIYELLHD